MNTHSGLRKTGTFVLATINLIVCSLAILSAFGGYFNPTHLKSIPAMAAMTFPLWIFVIPALLVVDLVFKRKLALIPVVTMLAGVGSFLNFCPLHISTPKIQEDSESFSILTYNALGFNNYKDPYTVDSTSICAVTESDADIVVLQECTEPQLPWSKQLYDIYPNHRFSLGYLGLLSKFKVISTEDLEISGTTESVQHSIIILPDGNRLSLYNVHLQSIGLSIGDKATYLDITRGKTDKSNISELRRSVLSKLAGAFRQRAIQAEQIRSYIDADTTRNLIVCGDFNDIPGCYAMRKIMGDDLHNAYSESGRGLSITYRDNRFYFHIDQILYRGNLRPIKTKVLRKGGSDHFPVEAIFELPKQQLK